MKRLHLEVKLAIGPSIENGSHTTLSTPLPSPRPQLICWRPRMRKIRGEKLKLERLSCPCRANRFRRKRKSL